MADRLSRVVTRSGDDGGTSLGDGTRTRKTALRIQALGDVDELNCYLGVVIQQGVSSELRDILIRIQHALFDLGGELSLPGQALIDASDVQRLEAWLEQYNRDLPPLKEFVLPGGEPAAAFCHCARAVCRRAERQLLALAEQESDVNRHSLIYLNRLSDLLFVLARVLVRQAGGEEICWDRDLRR